MGDVVDQTTTNVADGDATPGAGDTPPAGEGDGKTATPADGKPSGKEKSGDDEKGTVKIESILDEFGLDSPDELKTWLANFQDLKGKIGDADFDEILESHETLQTYQAKWAADEAAKLEEKETPEETIARLKREKTELQNAHSEQRENIQAAEGAKAAISSFNKTVKTTISADKEVPESWRPFVSEFMGVGNPINEVDIEDKAAVRKLTKGGITKMREFADLVIKNYREGKDTIPSVTHSTEAASQTGAPKTAKNLKDARRILHESLSGILNKT